MGKTAIILGATGLTGSILLKKLLEDPRYEQLRLFSRTSVGFKHPKLVEHLVDLLQLGKYETDFIADEVFCCIGTTKRKTPDRETYRKIDFGIPSSAARVAKKNNIETFIAISALGANANSRIFYNKTKGQMEESVLEQQITNTYLLQPSLIVGERKEKRMMESIGIVFMDLLNHILIGPLKKYRSIHAETIVSAMIYLANHPYPKNRLESDEIKRIAENS